MKILTLIVFVLSLMNASARDVVLTETSSVFSYNSWGEIVEVGTFFKGTELRVNDFAERIPGVGRSVLIERIYDAFKMESPYRQDLAMDINRTSHYEDYFISVRAFREERRRVVHNTSPRRVVNPPRFEPYREREICYETPRRRVVTINEEQRRRGNRNVVGGIIGAVGGQILGGITGNDRLGNVISAVGLGFAAVGAVQVASSKEVFHTDYEIDCRRYYEKDQRVYRFSRRGQRCHTTRFYTQRWGSTTEYFETICDGPQRATFITFERNYEIYAY